VSDDELPYLQHQPEENEAPHRVVLEPFPFRIGRSSTAHYVVHSHRVSKLHVEIDKRGHRFSVTDLDSRNGTFVNGKRIDGEARLKPGDVLHVAHKEFQFCFDQNSKESVDETILEMTGHDMLALGTKDLYRILTERAVRTVFQPIVRLDDRSMVVGYEALARNALSGTNYGPADLFSLAVQLDKAAELSRVMRSVALEDAPMLPGDGARVFINAHPKETDSPDFADTLCWVPDALTGKIPVLEIHEAAITDPKAMRRLRDQLADMGIELAYDDFGAGRSRLRELTEVPPNFIKLDMSLIRGIDTNAPRQELVRALTKVMNDLGTSVLAEGIETEAEFAACIELGCELAQGFLIQRPAGVATFQEEVTAEFHEDA